MRDKRKAVAIDFDAVIHSYTTKWTKPEEINDDPVPGAFDFIVRCQMASLRVVIFSMRCHSQAGIHAMRQWFLKHGLNEACIDDLEFTPLKPQAERFIDDRAFHFTGTFPDIDSEILNFVPWNKKVPEVQEPWLPQAQFDWTIGSSDGVMLPAPYSDAEIEERAAKAIHDTDIPGPPVTVTDPAHYRQHPSGVECIQITEHMNFCMGNAIKYLWRAGLKPEADQQDDLRKAVWYARRELKRLGYDVDV